MRKQRLLALVSVPLMFAGPTLGASVATAPAASAWSSSDAPPTAENLEALRWCESSNDYTTDTGNGYYGAYQFSLETWSWLGYDGWPSEAAPEVQDQAALDLYNYSNWDAWPGCSWRLGLR